MATVQEIVRKVNGTIRKYGLLSPEDLAKTLFDAVLKVSMPYGHIRGMSYENLAVVDANQSPWYLVGSMVHESGHQELHAGINRIFYQYYTYFPLDKYELEADIYGLVYAVRWYVEADEPVGNLYDFARLLGFSLEAASRVIEYCTKGNRLW